MLVPLILLGGSLNVCLIYTNCIVCVGEKNVGYFIFVNYIKFLEQLQDVQGSATLSTCNIIFALLLCRHFCVVDRMGQKYLMLY